MKYPYMQFFTGDWLKDPALSLCSPATRGIWMDLLCAMHELNRAGELRGTPEQLARAARCQPVELSQALTELQTSRAALVTLRNGFVTVANRRMLREHKERNGSMLRMRKKRSYGDVTPYARARASDLSPKSEVRDHKLKSDKGDEKALAKLTPQQKELADSFEKKMGEQWVNDSGKWVNRIKANFGKSERVFAELRSAIVESRIKTTPAQYAEQIWKEFNDCS